MSTSRIRRPLSLWSSIGRASLRPSRTHISPIEQRRTHFVPSLTQVDLFTDNGVPGLLAKESFDVSWNQYEQHLIDRLNELTAGTPEQNILPKDLALMTARDPQKAHIFNHASMAWNNHFFFKMLAIQPEPLSSHKELQDSLIRTYGSIETLRSTMLTTAESMFGPGFVWLVWAYDRERSGVKTGGWRILSTYLAGTPFPEAGYRMQDADQNTAGKFGNYSASARRVASRGPGTVELQPVLCVNTWEHVWLREWSITGKRGYLDAWWKVVNWKAVSEHAPEEAKRASRSTFSGSYR